MVCVGYTRLIWSHPSKETVLLRRIGVDILVSLITFSTFCISQLPSNPLGVETQIINPSASG